MQTTENKNKCKGEHSKHICQQISEMNKDIEKISGIVKNPKAICFNCARVADSPDFLCNPMPL